MKNKQNLKSLLGISQEEIAVLLGITRSQWSMYELGKRNLPLHAKQELAQLLIYLQKKETTNIELHQLRSNEIKEMQKQLENKLQIITHQKQLIARKIMVMEKLRKEGFAAMELVAYLKAKDHDDKNKYIILQIESRSLQLLKKNSKVNIEQLKMKQQLMEHQTYTLLEKIKSKQNESPDDFL